MIVAQGASAAIYLNDNAVAYFEDADFKNMHPDTLLFCTSTTQTVCEYNNVKIWNRANVPGLP